MGFEHKLIGIKERTVTQYQNSIHNALQDSQRVIELIDGLLNLADKRRPVIRILAVILYEVHKSSGKQIRIPDTYGGTVGRT